MSFFVQRKINLLLCSFIATFKIVRKDGVEKRCIYIFVLRTPELIRRFGARRLVLPHTMAPSEDDELAAISVTSKLIIQHTSTTQKGKKKPATKPETRVKTFDFVFVATRDNYALFLNTILKKHNVSTKSEATDILVFGCKFQVPPAKYVVLNVSKHTFPDNKDRQNLRCL
jgi:hypothetical protein